MSKTIKILRIAARAIAILYSIVLLYPFTFGLALLWEDFGHFNWSDDFEAMLAFLALVMLIIGYLLLIWREKTATRLVAICALLLALDDSGFIHFHQLNILSIEKLLIELLFLLIPVILLLLCRFMEKKSEAKTM